MCESYSRSLLRVSVAQICQALGWDSVQLSACHLLTDVLQRYLQQLGRGCHRYSELYGRTDPILDDVSEAFQLMGVSLHELEDYIHNLEPVTFPHQIPSFPVSKNNVLQFPPPGSKDAEERKEYIPEYLPPIVSSQEEEEEEQVPTDGGTSAEPMQVPLEEDEDLEEEEVINDENFLGKRPLDSPEAEEMPAVKRPRLLSTKGDALDLVMVEAREPLSSINAQKIPPMLSPVHVQDSADLAPPSPEPPMLAPVAKSQMPTAKPLDTKAFTPKAKTKTGSPGQKTKSPKTTQSPAVVGSPIRSPKPVPKEKKSPGRSKSPKSPKSPKVVSHPPPAPVRPETPNRTPVAPVSDRVSKETSVQVRQTPAMPDAGRPSSENQPRKAPVADKTIDDSIDAVIARACAEREPDPFEFSSGSESEGDIFTSPKRISGPECTTPKGPPPSNNFARSGPTQLPLSGGTSSSDNSWTMDASIDEVVRKAKLGTPPALPPNFPYLSSPSVSPPTPEPLPKVYEEKAKLPPSAEVKKKLKKELKTKMKKKEKQREKERDRDRSKDKSKERERLKEREREPGKESRCPWKELLKDEDADPYRFRLREFEEGDPKVRLKDGLVRKEREKHKEKKRDRERGKKEKEKRDKEKGRDRSREEKLRLAAGPLALPPKDVALALAGPAGPSRAPALFPSLSPMLPEKLFEEKEKPKEKERKKDRKEKKKKKEKEKEKREKEREKEKRERERREREKEKHRHEKIKVEPVAPAPSPVIPRLTLRVGGQDKIVISKVVPAPEAKAAPALNRPKTPPPAPTPTPAPLPLPLLAPAASPALLPAPAPTVSGAARAPVRSVVTETVSTYVIRDEWGNQIWICPGCNKPDDGSPMIGCDDCDDWYHWPCVGITAAPPEEMQWFCPKCANKKKDKKHKKRKHRAH
ncbi:transcription initiation factor TFIID subunit 3 [Sorex fumeus]|uniref:transcription initiation factor TFIID subunit 3 n=1 Tax=Sorex fumeus TaxID=62283 RepID=UPI0024AD6C5C|nr:transcription initiation factor TFIID subunit 3 [Sorex fumeus]